MNAFIWEGAPTSMSIDLKVCSIYIDTYENINIYIYSTLDKRENQWRYSFKKKVTHEKGRQPKTMYRCSSLPRLTKEGDHDKSLANEWRKYK